MRKVMLALAFTALAAVGCDAGEDYQIDLDVDSDTVRDTVRDTSSTTIRIPDVDVVDVVRDSVTIPIPKVRIDTNP